MNIFIFNLKQIFFTLLIVIILFFGYYLKSGFKNNNHQTVLTETSATPGSTLTDTEWAFLNNLVSLCGKSFKGNESYTAPGRESWADKKFVMHVTLCEGNAVHIPFHVDNDQSRTWMFIAEEKGLRFRHDHRHDDGTPEDITMYGGYADGNGTEFLQTFPADSYTLDMLGDDYPGKWQILLTDDLSKFYYRLIYNGEKVFEAEFGLTIPVEF